MTIDCLPQVGPFWRVADIRAATRNLRVNKAALRAAVRGS